MNRLFSFFVPALACLSWYDVSPVNGYVVAPTSSGSSGIQNRHRSSTQFITDNAFALRSATVPTEGPTTAATATTTTPETLILFSPCKINLFLRIIRKREDGYHDLASLFQAIGFGDTLELTLLGGDNDSDNGDTTRTPIVETDVFTCNMPGVPVDFTNLVLRALQLMRQKTGVNQYFRANLIKQVPAQAGLGGGSANAATAMWGANQLMGNPASLEDVSVVSLLSSY
jgi:4-diphosphocytidyl-2-C-methyl-D-erythritol kinase